MEIPSFSQRTGLCPVQKLLLNGFTEWNFRRNKKKRCQIREWIWLCGGGDLLCRWQDGFCKWKFKLKSASSILQDLSYRFCRLQFPCFCVPSFQDLLCFVQFKNPPRRSTKLKKQMGQARFRQRQACGLLTLRPINEENPQASCIRKTTLIFIFWK